MPAHLADGPTRHLVVAATRAGHRNLAADVFASTAARGVWRSADTWVFALRLRVWSRGLTGTFPAYFYTQICASFLHTLLRIFLCTFLHTVV